MRLTGNTSIRVGTIHEGIAGTEPTRHTRLIRIENYFHSVDPEVGNDRARGCGPAISAVFDFATTGQHLIYLKPVLVTHVVISGHSQRGVGIDFEMIEHEFHLLTRLTEKVIHAVRARRVVAGVPGRV